MNKWFDFEIQGDGISNKAGKTLRHSFEDVLINIG